MFLRDNPAFPRKQANQFFLIRRLRRGRDETAAEFCRSGLQTPGSVTGVTRFTRSILKTFVLL
jgi:hypothetical protein